MSRYDTAIALYFERELAAYKRIRRKANRALIDALAKTWHPLDVLDFEELAEKQQLALGRVSSIYNLANEKDQLARQEAVAKFAAEYTEEEEPRG